MDISTGHSPLRVCPQGEFTRKGNQAPNPAGAAGSVLAGIPGGRMARHFRQQQLALFGIQVFKTAVRQLAPVRCTGVDILERKRRRRCWPASILALPHGLSSGAWRGASPYQLNGRPATGLEGLKTINNNSLCKIWADIPGGRPGLQQRTVGIYAIVMQAADFAVPLKICHQLPICLWSGEVQAPLAR